MPKASSTDYNSDPEGPDFKSELLPLHSPLLGQSLLVSFPPLIDMLKFSGYSYLIRGQPWCITGPQGHLWVLRLVARRDAQSERNYCARGPVRPATGFRGLQLRAVETPQHQAARGLRVEMTLEQACPPECWRAQCAFKDSMIH